jgi:protease I
MSKQLQGRKVAILATDGFEQAELLEPKKALEAAGAEVHVVAPAEGPAKTQKPGEIRGWNHTDWGKTVKTDAKLEQSNADDYVALVLPGGVMNPDKLRTCQKAVEFVRSFFDAGKPVAAICHGPWTLIEADVVQGRTMTSWPSLKTDLKNAGANWVDREVVTDNGLVTSRKPDDLPAFNAKFIEEIVEGRHTGQHKPGSTEAKQYKQAS